MVLTILILVALILTFVTILLATYFPFKYNSFKDYLIKTFAEDNIHCHFRLVMTLFLFIIWFIVSAATYNTFIDKSNPNYYKNGNNNRPKA